MEAFADDFAKFADMVERIEDLAKAQAPPTTGITQDKRKLPRAMARAAMAAGPVAALAVKTSNQELLAKVDFRTSAPLSGRQDEHGSVPWDSGGDGGGGEQLGDYNIAAEDVKDLQDKIDGYDAIPTKPRETRASVKTITQQLDESFDEGD